MSAEDCSISKTAHPGEQSSSALMIPLQEALISCSKSIVTGDVCQVESSVSKLVEFIDSIFDDAAVLYPDNEDAKTHAYEVLVEINRYICCPSIDQAVIDALSLELPKAVAKFAVLSNVHLEIVGSIMDQFIAMSSPRDMLLILCEALDSTNTMSKSSGYIVLLLNGLSKVFLSIRRRHFEQLKVALPAILNVLNAVSPDSDDGDMDIENLFGSAIDFINAIHAVCMKLEAEGNENLKALLGLCILQIMALIGVSMGDEVSLSLPLVIQLFRLFPYCGLSLIGLITGRDVDKISSIVTGENEDNYMCYLPLIKHGAALSVIWSHFSDGVAEPVELNSVKDALRSSRIERWQALDILKHIFASANLPWELKKQTIKFLLCITDGRVTQNCDDAYAECSSYMPSIFAFLQAVEMVIMYTTDPTLRKNAFEVFKRVLADIPTSQRFDILKALIRNCGSSSMVAVLMDLVRTEMHTEGLPRLSSGNQEVVQDGLGGGAIAVFWSAGVLELIELVLRPPEGGPPSLPEDSDAVLSALNLYRFVLLRESSGKTNYTGLLSKNNLQKSYKEWLLPLRTLVTGTQAENKNDYDQLAEEIMCAINPVELVLYRCIELVEEKLKHPI